MFRRRRQSLAVTRAARALKPRRAKPPVAEAAPEFGFSSQIENGVRSLLAFFGGAARIVLRFVFLPHRFDRDTDDTGRLSPAVPPYTFLTLSTFVATTVFRALLVVVMVLWLVLARGCNADSEEVPEVPHLGELLRLPSAEEVITRGIPSVLLIIGVLVLLRWPIARRSPDKARRFFTVGLYIAGFQYLLAALALGVVLAGFKRFGGILSTIPHIDDAGALLLLGVIAWPALLHAFQLHHALPNAPRAPTWWRIARVVPIVCAAIVTSIATFLPGLGVAYTMAVGELAKQAQPRPLMEVTIVSDAVAAGPVPVRRLTVLVTAAAHRALHLLPGDAMLQRGIGPRDRLVQARVSSWQGADAHMLTIEPGHAAWVVLDTDVCPEPGVADCGMTRSAAAASAAAAASNADGFATDPFRRWLLVDPAYPIPDLAVGRVVFVEAAPMRGAGRIEAYVRGPALAR